MRWLLFLSRLSFICGIFLVLSFTRQIRDWTHNDDITATIIIIGYLMGLIVIPTVNLCYLLVLIIRKKLVAYIPVWLVVANILFLIFLLAYIIYQNASYNN